MYHTQEKRNSILKVPILCNRKDAWLGSGFYFWDQELDAIHWGNNSKRATGSYQIYRAKIKSENILDTVFNEGHYVFWVKQIEKAAKHISIKTGKKASLKEVNEYFKDKAKWSDIADGILFQDLPNSNDLLVIGLNYRKRIQLVVYNSNIINNFTLHLEMGCN